VIRSDPADAGAEPLPLRGEVALLCAFLFFVPLFEVPKQLLWLAWVALWLFRRAGPGLRALRWSASDLALGAFAASALTAGMFAGSWGRSLAEAGDALRLVSVALLVAHGGYRPRQLAAACAAALAGTVAALGWAGFELLHATQPSFLQLHSVGHVNHSAIYLAIALAIAIGLVLAGGRDPRWLRASLVAVALALCVSLFVAASRAALAAAVAFLLALAWAAPLRARDASAPREPDARPAASRRRFRILIFALLAAAALLYGVVEQFSPRPLQPQGESLSEKFESRPAQAGVLAFRAQLWRVAALAFSAHPVFGIGNGQFASLHPQTFCPDASGEPRQPAAAALIDPCDVSTLLFASHAHSLYANTLAERGALGLLAIGWLLGIWARRLAGTLAACRGDALLAGLWCASLGGWCITALAGLLNTTLHHEHGILAMFTLGALLAVSRSQPPAPGRLARR